MSLISDEVIDYEQWLWDREKAIEERWELMEVVSKCPFKSCPFVNDEVETSERVASAQANFIDGGGI